MDGYEVDDLDIVTTEKSNTSSDMTSEEIYAMLGCDVFNEE